MFSCFCHIDLALYTCSTIVYCLIASTRAKGNDLLYLVPTSNDDDVIKNYITDMDLVEDSDSHSINARERKRPFVPST